MRCRLKQIVLGCATVLALLPAWAGGCWYVDTENTGRCYHWPQASLVWYAQDGKLGPFTADRAQKEISDAFARWAKAGILTSGTFAPVTVPTASVTVKFGGVISGAIKTDSQIYTLADSKTFFVMDNDGSFIGDPNLGAMTYIHNINTNAMSFLTAFSILNGNADVLDKAKIDDKSDPNLKKFQAILVHEIGHMLNLDHSAVHSDLQGAVEAGREEGRGMPVMYPIIVSGAQKDLHTDDIVAISNLYPTKALTADFCEIAGRMIGADGKGYQGVHVVAESTLDPQTNAVGAVSGGQFWQGTADGTYILRGILPGVPYEVRYEEIPKKFLGASSVQPYGDEYDKTGELPRTGFSKGDITANGGTLAQVVCDKGGETIMMDTIQLNVSAGGVEPKVDLLPDVAVVPGSGNASSTGAASSGCSLILPE